MRFKIKDGFIGDNHPVFIVAELSGNHVQNFEIAIKTLKAIKESGADAVKLQTYTPDTITIDSENDLFRIKHGTLWEGKTLYKLYTEAYTPWEWQPKLMELAKNLGLVCFSSPFDKTAVDFLEKTMDVPAYKIASFEIMDIPLIEYVASKKKPIIISTGIATFNDIKEAVKACHRKNNHQISLLKCTSAYPAPLEEINLLTIPDMATIFKIVPGLSDHTLGTTVPIAAVALGAKIIEKHFILNRKLGGPDSAFSLEPEEFTQMVESIRNVEKALGKVNYKPTKSIKNNRIFARSLFAVKDIKAGEILNENNIRSIRPGYGLSPKYFERIVGKKARKNIRRGTPLSWNLVDEISGRKKIHD